MLGNVNRILFGQSSMGFPFSMPMAHTPSDSSVYASSNRLAIIRVYLVYVGVYYTLIGILNNWGYSMLTSEFIQDAGILDQWIFWISTVSSK
jgi:hypothetical protein